MGGEAFGTEWPKIPPSCLSSPHGYQLVVSQSKFSEREDISLPRDIELLCAFSDAWRGDFGHEQALLLRASILSWCYPEWSGKKFGTPFIPEPICRSFQLLRSVIDSNPMISLFDKGIKVMGKSGTLWRVECQPDAITANIYGSHWSVTSAESGNTICIHEQGNSLPLGDRLITVVLSFHDDIELAKRVGTVAHEMAYDERRTAAQQRELIQIYQEIDYQQHEVQAMPYNVEDECNIVDILEYAIPRDLVHNLEEEHWREYYFPEIDRRMGWYL
jgi:hypothetical protein